MGVLSPEGRRVVVTNRYGNLVTEDPNQYLQSLLRFDLREKKDLIKRVRDLNCSIA